MKISSTSRRHPLFRLLSYLRPHRKDYRLATLFSFLNKLFDIAPEILIGVAVDSIVKQQESWLASFGFLNIKNQLLVLGLMTFVIWILESITEYLYSVKWSNLAQSTQHGLRLDTYAHIQHLDLKTFEEFRTGNLLSILNDDINQLERFLEDGANQIIQICSSTVLIGAIFFIISPSIAVLAICPVPFVIWGAFFFQEKLAPRFLKIREKAGLLGSRLANNIAGIFTIKCYTSEDYEVQRIEKDSLDYLEANRAAIVWSSLVFPVIRIIILVGFLVTLVYGGFLTIDNNISVGAYSILVFLSQRLLWPLTELARTTVEYQRAMASTTRALDLLDTPIHIRQDGTALSQLDIKGKIVFDHVTFAYISSKTPAVKEINFVINPGETVGFVGTTGSGKSTLMKLLLHFYEPTQGAIFLDEKDIKTLNIRDLRKSIGIVSQDVFLFHGTIAENISYPNENVTLEEIQSAAKIAEAHEFIMATPHQYDSMVGESGFKLSGGQRQRISLARAILKNPRILILDEATSAVDNETEMAIQKSLKKITAGRTTIIIAHRLSTIRHAHRIFVMRHGKIIEKGTHEELLNQELFYSALWNLQTGQGIDEQYLD